MSTNYSGLSDGCYCLALYCATNQTLDYKKLCSAFSAIANKYNITITHGGVTGAGYSDSIKKIKSIYKVLSEHNFENVSSVNMLSVVSESNLYDEWQFYASVTSFPTIKGSELIICIDKKYELFKEPGFTSLVREVAELFRVDYGIAYTREYELGPYYYASGVIQGIDRYSIEAEKISQWFRSIISNNFFKLNLLRDIYPINLLNKGQLQAKLNSKGIPGILSSITLEAWIKRHKLGTLTPISDELWLWVVNDNLENISNELAKAKLLLHSA